MEDNFIILSDLADLGSMYIPDNAVVVTNDSQSRILTDMVSACDISRLSTSDVCDNVYSFIIQGDSNFTQSYEPDENDEVESKHFSVKDNIWRVALQEYRDGNNIIRNMYIRSISKNLLWDVSLLITTDRERIDNSSNVICADCNLLLDQVYNKVSSIVRNEKTIASYNEKLAQLLPDYLYTYYVKRSDIKSLEVGKDMSNSDKSKIQNVLKCSIDHDTKTTLLSRVVKLDENQEVTSKITPRVYVHAWRVAHEKSSVSYRSESTSVLDDAAYFSMYNSKGSELINKINEDGEAGWDNPSLLTKWGEEYSMYHCYDVIYARTHLSPYNNKLYYSNFTSLYVEEFLGSVVDVYNVLNDLLYIPDAHMYQMMLYSEDYVKLVPEYADKYLRHYKVPYGLCYAEYEYDIDMTEEIKKMPSVVRVNEFCKPIVTERPLVVKSILGKE